MAATSTQTTTNPVLGSLSAPAASPAVLDQKCAEIIQQHRNAFRNWAEKDSAGKDLVSPEEVGKIKDDFREALSIPKEKKLFITVGAAASISRVSLHTGDPNHPIVAHDMKAQPNPKSKEQACGNEVTALGKLENGTSIDVIRGPVFPSNPTFQKILDNVDSGNSKYPFTVSVVDTKGNAQLHRVHDCTVDNDKSLNMTLDNGKKLFVPGAGNMQWARYDGQLLTPF